jgi:hypothetical protein
VTAEARTQKSTNDSAPNHGISKNAVACNKNMARKTFLPPILSERMGHTSLPAVSDTDTITMKPEAKAAPAPLTEPAIALASE